MINQSRKKSVLSVVAALGVVVTAPAFAQSAATTPAADGEFGLEEIVVTARRKDESIQDVPATINAVTGAELAKLNLRKFEDIASVVPGLSMATNASGIGATASVRGVAYDVQASGNNGTIEFYLNDAPISAGNLFQALYDVQQVELLRGPQGTLRGRASPSGSMTVTTRRPDLSEMGGYASATATDIDGTNVQGAVGIPLIAEKLAIRVAGVYDKNEGNRVRSLNSSEEPEAETKSGRVTVHFEPTDSLSFTLAYQNTQLDATQFDAVESQQVINPSAPVNLGAPGGSSTPPFIRASQRLSVQDAPRDIHQDFDNYNLQAQWAFAGQRLNYVGARNEQRLSSRGEQSDFGNFLCVELSRGPAGLRAADRKRGDHHSA
jgi:iron complex outermembrane receptor protein